MHRFYLPKAQCSSHECVSTDEKLIHQIAHVLRIRIGDACVIFDGNGKEYLCKIAELSKKIVRFGIVDNRENMAELPFSMCLFQALPKAFDKFEWICQKVTELGVTEIWPVLTERTERESFSKRERVLRILQEASEQSGRGKIPYLNETVHFEKSLNENLDIKLLAHEKSETSISQFEFNPNNFRGNVGIWIGPEGGFTDGEVDQALQHGFSVFNLGPRILRTETAAIAAVSIITLHNCPV